MQKNSEFHTISQVSGRKIQISQQQKITTKLLSYDGYGKRCFGKTAKSKDNKTLNGTLIKEDSFISSSYIFNPK